MKAIIDRLINNKLEDLKGLSVEGEIPLTEDFINELLQAFLHNKNSGNANLISKPSSAANELNISQLMESLDHKDVKVEFREKVVVLKLNLKKNR